MRYLYLLITVMIYKCQNSHTACADFTFGQNCSKTCHCVDNTECDKVNGSCGEVGCHSKYSGPACQFQKGGDTLYVCKKCDVSWWGLNCTRKCHCSKDGKCDRKLGTCITQNVKWLPIILATSLSGAALISVVFVAACCVCKRRAKQRKHIVRNKADTSAPTTTRGIVGTGYAWKMTGSSSLQNPKIPQVGKAMDAKPNQTGSRGSIALISERQKKSLSLLNAKRASISSLLKAESAKSSKTNNLTMKHLAGSVGLAWLKRNKINKARPRTSVPKVQTSPESLSARLVSSPLPSVPPGGLPLRATNSPVTSIRQGNFSLRSTNSPEPPIPAGGLSLRSTSSPAPPIAPGGSPPRPSGKPIPSVTPMVPGKSETRPVTIPKRRARSVESLDYTSNRDTPGPSLNYRQGRKRSFSHEDICSNSSSTSSISSRRSKKKTSKGKKRLKSLLNKARGTKYSEGRRSPKDPSTSKSVTFMKEPIILGQSESIEDY